MGRISARGLSWSVKGRFLLEDVDLEAPDGKITGLLGPNGSGKTSLLRLLAGLRRPDKGAVYYDHTCLREMERRALARRLAVVEQDVSTHDNVRVRQVVELGRTPFRGRFDALTTRDHQIVDAAMVRANIADKGHRNWHTLSGGEKQRTQLARALAQEPREILLDEPTNHLDIRHQLELLDLLSRLSATCVIALHDLNLAARYCDHLVLLDRARVVAAGTPEAILTSELIGSVYGVEAAIDREASSNTLRVTYLAPSVRSPEMGAADEVRPQATTEPLTEGRW